MITNVNKLFAAFLFVFALFAVSACSRKNETESQQLYANESYSSAQLLVLFMRDFRIVPTLPDESYQLVNEEALLNFYKNYKNDLFSRGVVGWEENFDCNRFSQYYAALAQITYFKNTFRQNKAEALAIGEVYYVSSKEGRHAINVAVTPSRVVFLEPQTGKEVFLTEKEKQSIRYIKL